MFNDPTGAARRLAKRLHAAPYRLHMMLRAPPETRHRIAEFDALTENVDGAASRFNSG